jgi:hypothetical protein
MVDRWHYKPGASCQIRHRKSLFGELAEQKLTPPSFLAIMNLKAQGGIRLVTEQHESGAPVATISQYADLILLKHRSHQFFKA